MSNLLLMARAKDLISILIMIELVMGVLYTNIARVMSNNYSKIPAVVRRKTLLDIMEQDNCNTWGENEGEEYVLNQIQRQVELQIKYLLAEGVVVEDYTHPSGRVRYRLKTEEEVQAELDSILNS